MTLLHAIALALAAILPDAGLTPAEVDLGAAMVCAEARGASPMPAGWLARLTGDGVEVGAAPR